MKGLFALGVMFLLSQAQGQDVFMKQSTVTKECRDCKSFFADIKTKAKSTAIANRFEQLLDGLLCINFGQLEATCKTVVGLIIPKYFQTFANNMHPKKMCDHLGMCTSEMERFQKISQIPLSGDVECEACKGTVGEIRKYMQDPKFQTELKTYLEDSVCPLLGASADQCKQLVEEYAPIIFQVLANELDPTVVCETLGMCTKQRVHTSRLGLASSPVKAMVTKGEKSASDSATCTLCEFVLTEVDQQLGNNRTQAAIEKVLEEVCSYLPKTIQPECVAFIKMYGQEIINMLTHEIDPKQICTEIGLCTAAITTQKVKEDTKCVLCEFIMTTLDSYISQNSSQAEVERALEQLCGQMPATISNECKMFVEMYGPSIINILVHELDPKAVCKTLRFCTSANTVNLHKTSQLKVNGALCDTCVTVMTDADELLKENSTVQEVLHILENICASLSVALRSQCKTFVDEYTALVLLEMATNLDPRKVCTVIHLCDYKTLPSKSDHTMHFKKELLGKECTYGPSYWCANMDNAIKCDTVKHCENHVWN